MWFLHDPGLLGINARNLLYIKAYNKEKAILMADSKLKTKHFLSARGIPVAKLYASINDKKAAFRFNWSSLPNSFVVKPNSGFGGEGIIVIKSRKGIDYIKSNEEIITQKELLDHVLDILDGRYSINDTKDSVFFEQMLSAPEPFNQIAHKGLSDIRVIVHNLIPVMAMLRIPTRTSQGKANIHLGGIAAGIELSNGEITNTTQYGHSIKEVPDYGSIIGLRIPDWEKILLIASRVQQITNLGFAAVDITLDKTLGPVLLEINARAGLGVQIANKAPLRRRLERIEGIKVQTPEKGVRIAQDIFGEKQEKNPFAKKGEKSTIGWEDYIEIVGEKGTATITSLVDFNLEKSELDRDTAMSLNISQEGKCKLTLGGKRITTVVDIRDLSQMPNKIILGRRDLKEILVDPSKTRLELSLTIARKKRFDANELRYLDQRLSAIDSEIHLLSHLKPINLEQEESRAVHDDSYNPQFVYGPIQFNDEKLLAELNAFHFPDSPMGILWQKKSEEIQRKILLIRSIGKKDFTEKSKHLYGVPDENLIESALEFLKDMPNTFEDEGLILNAEEAAKSMHDVLIHYGLNEWKITIKNQLVSDVVAGKEKSLLIRAGATFTEERLKSLIAHEIETHVLTAVNGKRQPYKLFQRGLADYLLSEEGLAVYNQERTRSREIAKKYWPASSVIGVEKAMKGSFAEVRKSLIKLGFDQNRALRVAMKVKRGLRDTAEAGAFTRELLYFKGFFLIQKFEESGGDLRELYYGKININDLPLVRKVEGLVNPQILPSYLRTTKKLL